MSIRESFERHIEATSVAWYESLRENVFERDHHGQYTWGGLESRFVDFQAGHAQGLEQAAKYFDSMGDAGPAIAIRAMTP